MAEDRNYDPPIEGFEGAKNAAREIGKLIASKGWDLQVFSLNTDFIEYDAVEGYASPEVGDINKDLPDDAQRRWMGTAWSGADSAEHCVQALEAQMRTLAEEQRAQFEDEKRRREAELEQQRAEAEREQQEKRAATERAEAIEKARSVRNALILFCISGFVSLLATVFFVMEWMDSTPTLQSIASLLFAAVFGGATGSSILGIIKTQRSPDKLPGFYANGATILLGAAAGFTAGMIFILGQVVTLPDDQRVTDELRKKQLKNMIPFVALIGIVAELTWNRFFSRLQQTDLPTDIPTSSGHNGKQKRSA